MSKSCDLQSYDVLKGDRRSCGVHVKLDISSCVRNYWRHRERERERERERNWSIPGLQPLAEITTLTRMDLQKKIFWIPYILQWCHLLALCLAKGPPFINQTAVSHKRLIAYIGKNFRIRCPITATPPPYMQWSKDGHTINIAWERFRIQEMGLRIKDVEIEDSGLYTCKATNGFGSVQLNFTLTVIQKVQRKPQLLPPHPLNQTAQRGEQASFQCHVKSEVQPHIKWLKWVDDPSTLSNVNHTIEVKGRKFVVLKSGENWKRPDGSYVNKLTLKRITSEDSGLYICLGATSLGISSRQAFLKVHPDPKLYRPNQKIPPSTSGIPLLAICIPVVMLAIIIGAVFLALGYLGYPAVHNVTAAPFHNFTCKLHLTPNQ
ncbi:fibroblast growth factor receptor-like 1 [Octopus vulgaris]|uniref:receptor protein-tyrosine kinase n=1 Tax=Octopus vulgaris TaxID=6645 RepID=A0AA36BGF2_OCTVU|nr:fibroblast growth factor receptor-like 1 [Octopus vulgaris]